MGNLCTFQKRKKVFPLSRRRSLRKSRNREKTKTRRRKVRSTQAEEVLSPSPSLAPALFSIPSDTARFPKRRSWKPIIQKEEKEGRRNWLLPPWYPFGTTTTLYFPKKGEKKIRFPVNGKEERRREVTHKRDCLIIGGGEGNFVIFMGSPSSKFQ